MKNCGIQTLSWEGELDGKLVLLDQTKLPQVEAPFVCQTVEHAHNAIQRLVVRGAPAIGIAAAYGVCLAMRPSADNDLGAAHNEQARDEQAHNEQAHNEQAHNEQARDVALRAIDYLATSRPTAVNLFWALDQMRAVAMADSPGLPIRLLETARRIHEQDRKVCYAIGRKGASVLSGATNLLTHCNAGALAASEWGTALAVIYALAEAGKSIHVFADETRPLMQGARLTAWELNRRDIPVTVICDSMAGSLMQAGKIDAVIVGADRIAANGDVANKIGTYSLAVLARYHKVPFYVAAPTSTFDRQLASGSQIPIEMRNQDEIAVSFGQRVVPERVPTYNPAFDVTPAELIDSLITEQGVIRPVQESTIRSLIPG